MLQPHSTQHNYVVMAPAKVSVFLENRNVDLNAELFLERAILLFKCHEKGTGIERTNFGTEKRQHAVFQNLI